MINPESFIQIFPTSPSRYLALLKFTHPPRAVGFFSSPEAAHTAALAAIGAMNPARLQRLCQAATTSPYTPPNTARKRKSRPPEPKQPIQVKPERTYVGVSKTGFMFRARILVNQKQQVLGPFDTAEAAAHAYDLANLQKGKPPVNFPRSDYHHYNGVIPTATGRFDSYVRLPQRLVYLGEFVDEASAQQAYQHELDQRYADALYDPALKEVHFPCTPHPRYEGVMLLEDERVMACVVFRDRYYQIGMFTSAFEAAKAYDRYLAQRGELRANFPSAYEREKRDCARRRKIKT